MRYQPLYKILATFGLWLTGQIRKQQISCVEGTKHSVKIADQAHILCADVLKGIPCILVS